jgi:pimeloyl-ACP methyl ester carboxylesterase
VAVTAGGIFWERTGEGAATPAVLVMGLATDSYGWERQVPELARERPVIVLDNRGVGRSARPPGPYTTALLADDVASVLDAAGVDAAHVAGISLGGMIAQELALRHPSRLRSLALLATWRRPDPQARKLATGGPPALDPRGIMSFLMPLVFSEAFIAAERDQLKAFFLRSLAFGFSLDGFRGQLSAAMTHDAPVEQIGVRTLVITGTEDRLIPPRCSRELAAAIPGSHLVEIPGGTHGLNFEHARAVTRLLSEWWAR